MGILSRSVLVCALSLWFAMLACPAAAAEPESMEDRDTARALADRGWELFREGKYDEAIAVLQKAERQHHAPSLLLAMARVHDKAGRLVEARDLYERVTSEALAPDAPDAFRAAQRAARTELAAIRARIPTLKLSVRGRSAGTLTVEIDKHPISAGALTQAVSVNPGRHRITVRSGENEVERVVTAREGTEQDVELAFQPEPSRRSANRPSVVERGSQPGSMLPAGIAFGVAGVAALGGAVTGIWALRSANDVKDRCIGNQCPPESQSDADRSKTIGNVSTVAFVIAGVGAGTGVVLLLLRPSAKSSASRLSAEIGVQSTRVTFEF